MKKSGFCILFVVLVICVPNVIADDTGEEFLTLGNHIISAFKEIAPIYTDLRDDLAIFDSEMSRINNQKLEQAVENALKSIGSGPRTESNSYASAWTKKEGILLAHYVGYLTTLQELATLISKVNSGNFDAKRDLPQKGDTRYDKDVLTLNPSNQIFSILKSCKENGIECGATLPEIKELQKPIRVFVYQAVALSSGPCLCDKALYNCCDFSSQRESQACYDYCMSQTGRDIHDLSRGGGQPCSSATMKKRCGW